MTLLVFLLLCAAKGLNSPYKTFVAVLCLGLDQLIWLQLVRIGLYLTREGR